MWVPGRNSAYCECEAYAVDWIRQWFGDCVHTPWEMLGFAVGLSSILCWLVAQLPQFVHNIRCQSAEALSPWFLFQWLSGDTLNLLGCILTGDQLPTETFTACYFIFADSCIISQYVYYQIRNRDKGQLEGDASDSESSVQNPAGGYYSIFLHRESDHSQVVSTSQLSPSRPPSSPHAGTRKPSQIKKSKKKSQQQYRPVTFVTGRSGAVMIAHAWQGPHKPLSPPLPPPPSPPHDIGHTPTRVRDTAARTSNFAQKDPSLLHRPSEFPPFSSAATNGHGEITFTPNAHAHAHGGLHAAHTSTLPPPVVNIPVPASSKGRDVLKPTKNRQRSIRRVVEEYGLEYGPPLHARLTIHHNWQGNAHKVRPSPLFLKPPRHSHGARSFVGNENMTQSGTSEPDSGPENCVHGNDLINITLGLPERDSGSSSDAHRRMDSTLQSVSNSGTYSESNPRNHSESNSKGQRSAQTHLERIHEELLEGNAGSKQGLRDSFGSEERSNDEATSVRGNGSLRLDGTASVSGAMENVGLAGEVTLGEDQGVGRDGERERHTAACNLEEESCVCHSSELPDSATSINELDGEGNTFSRKCALACIAGLIMCTSLLQPGGGYTSVANLDRTIGSEDIGVLVRSEVTGLQSHTRKLLDDGSTVLLNGMFTRFSLGGPLWFRFLKTSEGLPMRRGEGGEGGGHGRRLLVMCGDTDQSEWVRYLGLILGWISAGFYLGSRVSQIVRNSQRNSAEGLSMAMFLCAFLANLTYGAAIVMRATTLEELTGKAPWLVGSMGTLSLDITIFMQAQYLQRRSRAAEKQLDTAPLLRQVV